MSTFKRSALASSISLAIGFSAVLPVSSYAVEEGLLLEEVKVTARRRTESLQDVPISITALSEEG